MAVELLPFCMILFLFFVLKELSLPTKKLTKDTKPPRIATNDSKDFS